MDELKTFMRTERENVFTTMESEVVFIYYQSFQGDTFIVVLFVKNSVVFHLQKICLTCM